MILLGTYAMGSVNQKDKSLKESEVQERYAGNENVTCISHMGDGSVNLSSMPCTMCLWMFL
jgi:hypothetical protein